MVVVGVFAHVDTVSMIFCWVVLLIAFPYDETLAPSWHLEQERGRHQELVSKGGAYCKLLAAAGEMWGAKGAKGAEENCAGKEWGAGGAGSGLHIHDHAYDYSYWQKNIIINVRISIRIFFIVHYSIYNVVHRLVSWYPIVSFFPD